MSKGFFLSLPSVSVNRILSPVIGSIASAGDEILYYNTEPFLPTGAQSFITRAYPSYPGGYHPACMNSDTSYFQFGAILLDTAGSLLDFLIREIEVERPDYIMYSHLAVWGKLLARRFDLPAITLMSTMVLEKSVMLPYFRSTNVRAHSMSDRPQQALDFYRKYRSLYARLGLTGEPGLWDVYVNEGDLNLAFIPPSFQPDPHLLQGHYHFLGYPGTIGRAGISHEVVYISLGTILNDDLPLYLLCLQVLEKLGVQAILSVGAKIDLSALPPPAPGIDIVRFTDQVEVLKRAAVFVTRGGIASIMEGLHTLTPMVVVPCIPEQMLNAQKVQELGLGYNLPSGALTRENLQMAIRSCMDNRNYHIKSMRSLLAAQQQDPAGNAARLIREHTMIPKRSSIKVRHD